MGTLQHDAVESGEDNNRIPDYKALVVEQCRNLVAERIAEFGIGSTVIREEYLPCDDEQIQGPDGVYWMGTTGGYADFCIVNADQTHAEIIDWKFGKNAVTDAKDNLQGISYMLGLKRRFPKLKTCRVLFFQPHIDHESDFVFDISVPEAFHLRVRTVVARAIEASKNPQDFSMARATVGTCLFCSLVGVCPKVAELAIQVAKKYAPLVVPDDINTVSLEDPVKVSQGMKLAQVVKLWAESFRKNATTKAANDEEFIPEGYVMVPMSRIKLSHPKKVGEIAKRFLPEEHREKVEALYDVAITNLDELIQLAAPRNHKEKTVAAFRQAIVDEGAAEVGPSFNVLRMKTDKDSSNKAAR